MRVEAWGPLVDGMPPTEGGGMLRQERQLLEAVSIIVMMMRVMVMAIVMAMVIGDGDAAKQLPSVSTCRAVRTDRHDYYSDEMQSCRMSETAGRSTPIGITPKTEAYILQAVCRAVCTYRHDDEHVAAQSCRMAESAELVS